NEVRISSIRRLFSSRESLRLYRKRVPIVQIYPLSGFEKKVQNMPCRKFPGLENVEK
ncbi:unnamed protein product, partial [Ceratitis capitata]